MYFGDNKAHAEMEASDRKIILIKTTRGGVRLHVCGYTHGCMCVGINVSRLESTVQQRASLVEKQVNKINL